MSYQFTAGRFKGWASDNTPLAAGRLYTYSSGTTTHKAAYTDATLGASCTYVSDGVGGLYIALDSKGEAQLWLGSGAYTFKLTDSSGSTVWTVDGVRDQSEAALSQLSASSGSSLVGFMPSGAGAVARTQQDKDREFVSVKDFGAVGDGVTDDTAAFATALASGAMRIYVPYTASQYVITGALSVPRGVILYGDTLDQPGILCKTSTAGDIVFFTVTGNTQLENLRIYGDSATSGTLVSLTGGTYSFTGNIRMKNVRLYLAKVGLFINSIFNSRIDGCEFRGCKSGVDASPLTDGGDNGYINAVTFSNCYWGTNTDYDVYANPAVRVSVLSFKDCTFDPGPTLAKVYLKNANPCSFRDSYFEGGSTTPAIKGTGSTVTVETSYFTGTKGVEYDNTQASLVMRQCRTGSSTDIVNAGYTLHTLRILDTTLPASGNVFDSKSVKYFDNATINGTTYNLVRNESATFTPTLTGTGGTSAHTYVWQTGYYTRIGNSVHFHAVVRVSALDAGMTGTARINLVGLPASQNATLNNVVCNVALQSVTLSASRTHAFGRIDLNTNIVEIYEEGSNVTASLMPVGNLTASAIIWVSGHYLVTPGT